MLTPLLEAQNRSDLVRVLDLLCPMHFRLDQAGRIVGAGPTARRLAGGVMIPGLSFFDLFDVQRPRGITTMERLMAQAGLKLHLRLRAPPYTALKGVLVAMRDTGGAVVNLSFGISVLEGVRDFSLTSADFAATDLTVEMLYLIEAKSAAMEASLKLNLRLQGAMIAAEEQAFTDTLTGLKNRRAMDHVLERHCSGKTSLALMQIDLDFFKAVNDRLGHAAGDHVLQHVARILVEEIRNEDVAARIGGDEFVLIFNRLTDPLRLRRVAERLITQLEEPIPYDSQMCSISASIGIATILRGQPGDAAGLLHRADLALYASKDAGRGCYRFYTPALESGVHFGVRSEERPKP